jgi:hypothetical protein
MSAIEKLEAVIKIIKAEFPATTNNEQATILQNILKIEIAD